MAGVFALFVYPGLIFVLVLVLGMARLAGVALPAPTNLPVVVRGRHGILVLLSMLLLLLATLLLPWPFHPIGQLPAWSLGLVWLLVEGAALVPLLPGLFASTPIPVRSAVREAQLGMAGRVVVWVSVGAGLAASGLASLPGCLLALVAGILALPAATGLGPFGPETSLEPQGLDEQGFALLRLARLLRALVLLGLLMVTAAPLGGAGPLVLLIGVIGLAIVFALSLRVARAWPRFTLVAGLRWCWWRAGPLALAGLVYVLVM